MYYRLLKPEAFCLGSIRKGYFLCILGGMETTGVMFRIHVRFAILCQGSLEENYILILFFWPSQLGLNPWGLYEFSVLFCFYTFSIFFKMIHKAVTLLFFSVCQIPRSLPSQPMYHQMYCFSTGFQYSLMPIHLLNLLKKIQVCAIINLDG